MNTKSYFIILFLLGSILVIWLFVFPQYQAIKENYKEVKQKETEIQRLENFITKLRFLENEYKENEESVNKLYKIIPKEAGLPEVLNNLEFLNLQSGMILNSINFAEVSTTNQKSSSVSAQASETSSTGGSEKETIDIKTITVNIKASGSYDSFRNFLNNLEKYVRLTDVQRISFSNKDEQGDIFEFNLAANIYYQ